MNTVEGAYQNLVQHVQPFIGNRPLHTKGCRISLNFKMASHQWLNCLPPDGTVKIDYGYNKPDDYDEPELVDVNGAQGNRPKTRERSLNTTLVPCLTDSVFLLRGSYC